MRTNVSSRLRHRNLILHEMFFYHHKLILLIVSPCVFVYDNNYIYISSSNVYRFKFFRLNSFKANIL